MNQSSETSSVAEQSEPAAGVASAEQGALSALLGRLVALQEATHNLSAQQQLPPHTGQCKPPAFDGTGDVEAYLAQFDELANYYRWEGVLRLFKLREGLQRDAAHCVAVAKTYTEARGLLLEQFCEKPATAREKLAGLKRDRSTPLRVFAREVKRLVDRGHGEVAPLVREKYALEAFARGAGHSGLRRHLQAMQVDTLEGAVTASEVYYELGDPVTAAREVDVPAPERVDTPAPATEDTGAHRAPEEVRQAELEKRMGALSGLEKRLDALLGAVERLTARETSGPRQAPTFNPPRRNRIRCYGCHQEGHIRRDCPRGNPKPSSNE